MTEKYDHFERDGDGTIRVDPDYAGRNPSWFALMKVAGEVLEVAAIGKTPMREMTPKKLEIWKDSPLRKVATDNPGANALETVADWLIARAAAWPPLDAEQSDD